MKKSLFIVSSLLLWQFSFAQNIPLPEHPRPDFERTDWQNLNGEWAFEFDSLDVGLKSNWASAPEKFTKKINVPFPWGSKLSGVKDEAGIAWYARNINVPAAWKGKKTFFTIGASDWHTTVWLDGKLLGEHKGGYTPFSVDLTPHLKYGTNQKLVVRVDDVRRMFTLYGKQGYGNARGIWQTAYLEARGNAFIDYVHFVPNIDNNTVTIRGEVSGDISKVKDFTLRVKGLEKPLFFNLKKGSNKFEYTFDLPDGIFWTLENPHLYDVILSVADDAVRTYFGFRKISVVDLPGTKIPYIALNNKPIYLQTTLDQSYHPDGFYTFPSDEFMRKEIQLCKDIGLNGLRTHIKIDVPRKLYWADKLGLLVMADLPNSWGEPDEMAQAESERTLREMIKRDFNHPAIFSWIVFNETWGLVTNVAAEGEKEKREYLPKTQNWVASMYYLAKSLDETRLVEDNSICCGRGHTETDINSWHAYLPGYEWENFMADLVKKTYEGSEFHFEKGFKQGNQPMINSECGNVWGYEGSTGDVDWSYDYHQMMNVFRKYPEMAGWLYTEHHDVINEWNGYWKFDRSPKFTGLEDLANGMKNSDFHSLIYLSTGNEITRTVKASEKVKIPLYLSSMTDKIIDGTNLVITYWLSGIDYTGNSLTGKKQTIEVPYKAWMQKELPPLTIEAPKLQGVYQVIFEVKDEGGNLHHRNFFTLDVQEGKDATNYQILEVEPADFVAEEWSEKSWKVLDGLKMNGAGKGYFEYELKGSIAKPKSGYLLMELGAKKLFAKDRDEASLKPDLDYMLGAVADPSQNKNSYPMTDSYLTPSDIEISIDGKTVTRQTLFDDSADHRGVLSWHYQLRNRTLREAGSYGYLVKVPLTTAQLKSLGKTGKMKVKIESTNGGGIAVYGKTFGRYAFNPSIVLETK
jgi:hypothetical protein